jgi:hypothetical protein
LLQGPQQGDGERLGSDDRGGFGDILLAHSEIQLALQLGSVERCFAVAPSGKRIPLFLATSESTTYASQITHIIGDFQHLEQYVVVGDVRIL